MSEKALFLSRFNQKVANGLKSIHLFPSGVRPENEEAVYAELNRMDEAPDLSDPELLGDRSP